MSNEELIVFLKKNAISVVCVIVSILIGLAIYYRSDLLPEAEKVLASRTAQGELLAANIEDSGQLKEQHAAISASNEAITNRMIIVGQKAENLQYFYRLESDTNTKLTGLRQVPLPPPAKNAPKTNFVAVPFSFTAQGDYGQLIDLLRRLENGEHYCRIITCNLRPLTTDIRGGQLALALSIELMAVQ
jgi:hypothetical protein